MRSVAGAVLGSLVWLLIAPGLIAGYLPWAISRWRLQPPFLGTSATRWMGAVLILLGLPLLLEAFARFALQGRGTPAPVLPPERLVVFGFYRRVRNPMYVAVTLLILGQGLLLGDVRLLALAAVVWVIFHVFVLLYEEPLLRRRFGRDYAAYCAAVPRWVPRLRPWRGALLTSLALSLLACGKETPVAPSLLASCSANPGSGTAPLAVSFALNVSGAQGPISVRINYGDGSTGAEVGAAHVYASAGSFTASFDVTTPTQSALCTAAIQVAARPAQSPTATPPSANREPEIHFRTAPEPTAGLTFDANGSVTIQFNMCTSSDPEGDPLNFRMDFEGDGRFEVDGPTGADCRRSHTYAQAGSVSPTLYEPRLCATDLLPSRTPAHPYRCRSYTVKVYR